MEAGEFSTIHGLAEAVGLAERHVSRQLRLAYLAPEVLKRPTCGREALAVSLYDLFFLAGKLGGAARDGVWWFGDKPESLSLHKITITVLPVSTRSQSLYATAMKEPHV